MTHTTKPISRCNAIVQGEPGGPPQPCSGKLYSDRTTTGGCHEPCSWAMRKSGHGLPPFLAPDEAIDLIRTAIAHSPRSLPTIKRILARTPS